MRSRLLTNVALFVGLALMASTTVHAATVCVNPGRSGCENTIQAGVDAATSGDTVKIANGVYFENVSITTSGITVSGGRKAILDPTFPGTCSVTVADACYVDGDCPGVETCQNQGDGDGVSVGANDVELKGFTIRNGQDNSIQIEPGVTGTEISGMQLFASDSYCIYGNGGTSAGPTIVERNEFRACGSDCLYLSGTWHGVDVSRNNMMQCNGYGVDFSGDDAIVERNLIDNMDGDGVEIDGDRAEVVRNRISMIYDVAVEVTGDDALIESNQIDNVSDHAIELDGNGAMVTRNKLTNIAYDYAIDFEGDNGEISRNTIKGTDESGMDVECDDGSNACTDGIVIERNKLTDIGFDDYEGIDVSADAGAGGVDILRNNLRNVGYHGIDYSGAAGSGPATIERNSVRNAGREGDECFDFDDSDLDSLVLDRNTARDCGGHGFDVDGTAIVVSNNKVKTVGDAGVNVDGTAVNIEVTDNNISGAAKNGVEIESGATGTSVEDNTIKNNRLDICDEGTGSTIAGNKPNNKLTSATELCANL
jgi:hypothetical protein